MQEHVWIVQVFSRSTGKWVNYTMAQSRSEAREFQRTTSFTTRIRKFIAA
ncbi:hypothetical protein [Bordetella genomosp. 9]|nr:hypothetical protein [Bordetella genomosp. 9]